MDAVIYLGLLIIGMAGGAFAASYLVKSSRGPNLAASEAEVAEWKARLEEREKVILDLRKAVDQEKENITSMHALLRSAEGDRAKSEERATQVPKLEAELAEREQNINRLQTELATQQARHASLLTRLDEAEKAQAEKMQALEAAQAKLAETFKGVASEALAANNQNFLALAETAFQKAQEVAKGDLDVRQKAIDDTLRPLQEVVTRMEKERVEAYASLGEQVKSLNEAQRNVQIETNKLVHALRAPAVRGRWGEMTLRRVVEMAGMVDYCDFQEQVSVDTEGGKLRPDMIIHLPNHREIVVDAKVSLAAYLDSLDLTDEGERHSKIAEHATQVRTHVQRLSAKSYWDQFEKAPDFVVAFLPGESFFSAALQKDPELIEFGVVNKVILATPTTLIALLKAVSYGWRQEKLTENAQEISALGKELFERLRTFAGHMDGIRGGLERSVESYNKAVGSLESRVLTSARRFQELGAAPGEDIEQLEPVEKTPRTFAAPGLAVLASVTSNGSTDDH